MPKNDNYAISLWDIPLALVLLTRLPLPRLPGHVFARQASAVWAFPVVGLVVGAAAALTSWLTSALGLSPYVDAILIMAVLIGVTGAMHEDGLADTFDGLWGGFTPERRLEIMKDSHIGTYGVLALIVSQLLRNSAIITMLLAGSIWSVVAACIFSRAVLPAVMTYLPHARNTGLSHSVGKPPSPTVFGSLGLGVVFAIVLSGGIAILGMVSAAIAVVFLCVIARKKIGGQTGDILGACQQLAEITFLLAISAQI